MGIGKWCMCHTRASPTCYARTGVSEAHHHWFKGHRCTLHPILLSPPCLSHAELCIIGSRGNDARSNSIFLLALRATMAVHRDRYWVSVLDGRGKACDSHDHESCASVSRPRKRLTRYDTAYAPITVKQSAADKLTRAWKRCSEIHPVQEMAQRWVPALRTYVPCMNNYGTADKKQNTCAGQRIKNIHCSLTDYRPHPAGTANIPRAASTWSLVCASLLVYYYYGSSPATSPSWHLLRHRRHPVLRIHTSRCVRASCMHDCSCVGCRPCYKYISCHPPVSLRQPSTYL